MFFFINKSSGRIIKEIIDVSSWLWEKGWAERNAGNISVDVTGIIKTPKHSKKYPKIQLRIDEPILRNRLFIVTATGARMRDIKNNPEKTLLVVLVAKELDGYYIIAGGGNGKTCSTSEFISHLLIHSHLLKNEPDKKAIIHTHPPGIIALSHIKQYADEDKFNQLIWSMHPEVKIVVPEGIGFVHYNCPGTEKLARASIKSLKNHRIIVWERHGCVAVGDNLYEAFDLIDTIEKAIQIFFMCKNAGFEPGGLTNAEIKELEHKFLLKRENG